MADINPQDAMNQILDNVNKVGDKLTDMAKSQEATNGTVKNLTEALKTAEEKQEEMRRELAALQQKAAAPAVAGVQANKSLGDQFITAKGFEEAKKSARGRDQMQFRLELAAAPQTTQAANSATRTTIARPAELGLVTDPTAVLNIESLFPHITVDSGSYQYVKIVRKTTLTATGPAVTAEGSAKPESNWESTIKTGVIQTIAGWVKMTEQMLEDNANIATFINDDLKREIDEKVEAQIVNGSGSGELSGLTASGNYTDYSSAAGLASGDTVIDIIIKYRCAMEAANIKNLVLLLNSKNWCKVLTAKNANKDYLIPGIVDIPAQRIWGIPVVLNANVPDDKFIMGNFAQAGKVVERSGLSAVMERTEDDLLKNLTTLRMERRLDFEVVQPKAVTYGDFVTVS